MKIICKALVLLALSAPVLFAADAPATEHSDAVRQTFPILSKFNAGRAPSERILKRGDHDIYAILHFGVNTFTDREWGYGDEAPQLFAPTAFDAEQIVKACRDGGITGIIIVCKHHDGLCLWPTKTTEHNISKTKFRDGKWSTVLKGKAIGRKRLKRILPTPECDAVRIRITESFFPVDSLQFSGYLAPEKLLGD